MKSNTIISWACNNWYHRPDGLIEIYNRQAEFIILNARLGKVWSNISYETTYGTLIERLKGMFSEEELKDLLGGLEKSNLLYIIKEEDAFNSIFN